MRLSCLGVMPYPAGHSIHNVVVCRSVCRTAANKTGLWNNTPQPIGSDRYKNGEPRGIRTRDARIKSPVLYQLS